MMALSGDGTMGFDARLRLISVLFFAISVAMMLVVANTSLTRDDDPEVDRAALNAIAAAGAVVALAIQVFPWRRYPRDAFFVVPAAATLLLASCIYFSGGWDSFAYRLYVLVAVFYGLYFPLRLILLGMSGVVLAGASPMLYEPDPLELVEYLVVPTPVYLASAFVSGYVVRQVALREEARRVYEARLRTERERRQRLQREAEIDGLTGIFNRRHLEKRLDEEIERSRRTGAGFALLFADLDDFKAINDEHGHLLGDDALRLVARTLDENARRIDVVARYGGEEFLILMLGTDPEGARTFYERVRGELARASQEELGLVVRLSAGAVGSRGVESAEELLEASDRAMYEAKRRGKDRIFVPGEP